MRVIAAALVLCALGKLGYSVALGLREKNQSYEPIIAERDAAAQALVKRAGAYLQSNASVHQTCHSFLKDKSWRDGELYPMVFDEDGYCYTAGDDIDCIWHDFSATHSEQQSVRTDGRHLPFEQLRAVAQSGGFLDYPWNYSHVRVYAESFAKEGKNYILASGFFPESAHFTVQQLVHEVRHALLTEDPYHVLTYINNPRGRFVRGSLYVFVLTPQGEVLADGKSMTMVGQNLVPPGADAKQNPVKAMINQALKEGKGWYEYVDTTGRRAVYLEKVLDAKTQKTYIVGSGYYHDVSQASVVSFVARGAAYLRSNGLKNSVSYFQKADVAQAGLRLFLCDMKGTMLADGETPDYIGRNLSQVKDEDGKLFMSEIVAQAEQYGKGWVSYKDKNAYRMVYIEKVSLSDESYIVGSGFFPYSKAHWCKSFVDKASDYLQGHTLDETLFKLSQHSPEFWRGDIHLYVYDDKGYVLSAGPRKMNVWRNNLSDKDEKGVSVMDRLTAVASTGGGWISFPYNKAVRRFYVKGFEKQRGESGDEVDFYIIGSAYYIGSKQEEELEAAAKPKRKAKIVKAG
jgi:hypothetical protein